MEFQVFNRLRKGSSKGGENRLSPDSNTEPQLKASVLVQAEVNDGCKKGLWHISWQIIWAYLSVVSCVENVESSAPNMLTLTPT